MNNTQSEKNKERTSQMFFDPALHQFQNVYQIIEYTQYVHVAAQSSKLRRRKSKKKNKARNII